MQANEVEDGLALLAVEVEACEEGVGQFDALAACSPVRRALPVS